MSLTGHACHFFSKTKRLFITGILFFFSATIFSQQYTFINYSTENGLAQSQVSAMCQDKDGYIWFATFGGLSRFDGKIFVNFTKTDGLPDNQLYSIYADNKNRIITGTIGGYSIYENRKFSNHSFPKEFASYNVVAISEDQSGNLWFALEGGGVVVNRNGIDQFYGKNHGVDPNVRHVFCDTKNRVWLATRSGLFHFSNNRFVNYPINGDSLKNISYVMEDKQKKLWIATYDQGIYAETGGKDFINYSTENGLVNDWVRTIFVDDRNMIWIGTKTGISKFDRKEFSNFSIEQGLINDNIKCISQDSEGNIWLGTDGKGIMKFAGEAFITYTTAEGLSSDFVMNITEDKEGNLWFATYGAGVCRYDGRSYTVFDDESGLSNNTVWTTVTDKAGNVWFGTSNGLSVYDGKKIISYYEEDGLLSNKVTSLLADDSVLWIGNREGLSKFTNGKFTGYGPESGIEGGNIRSVCKDKNGTLWLGGVSGLFAFDGKKAVKYVYDKSTTDNTVYCITEDKRGNLWVGTKSGLFLFENKTFTRIPLGESVNANNINFIIFENDTLWAGTNNSIYAINTTAYLASRQVEYRNYSRLEGVRGQESNMNAAFRDSKGFYWFGTDMGLVRFDPSKIDRNENKTLPFIHISDVRLFFEKPDWQQFTKTIDPSTGIPKNLVVNYDNNHFTFYFTGIYHTNPDKVRYIFKLEGFDEEWSPETNAPFITYSNLPHGTFTFMVKARNVDGPWSEPAVFSFTITPPFWLTWWFYSLCIIGFLSVVLLIYQWRISVIRRNNERERLIYKSRLLTLEQQTLNASMNRHFIFNALNSIQYYINKQDRLEANKYLTSFAKLIRKNLDSSASGNLVSLTEELERLELYLTLENMRFKNKFSYEIIIDKNVDTEAVKIPPMLLQPWVENSIWHGILPMENPGHITIRIYPESHHVAIRITDNGIGIETSLKNKQKEGSGHVSRGIEITSGRLEVLKKLTNENLQIRGPYDLGKNGHEIHGTEVILELPTHS
ncbi:MAG: two-component regulator propeller domain-containing protein [Bacteroidota bacterium]